MCGICGIVYGDREKTVASSRIESMCTAIAHRGPDASAVWCDDHVGLGHRRLSIIDLEGGKQPMVNEDGSVCLVYNGELYNYQGVKKTLSARGHRFMTNSDTEVIVRAYEEYGTDCLKHFRGMFAFALYDKRNDQLFAARDRIGIKPLYYTLHERSLIFASEIKSVLGGADIDRSLNQQGLYSYFRLRYIPGGDTVFRNVNKLQPGHYLLFKGGKLSVTRYWDLADVQPLAEDRYSVDELTEQFSSLLKESVEMRMMSEVPLGALLSGGLDSSVVVALMTQLGQGQRVKTFSVGYKDDHGVNEFDYARQVAEAYGTEHYECHISSKKFFDFIPRLVWHLDEPIADSACIPLFFLSEYARDYVTVVLSGEGADELLSGYGLYQKMLLLRNLDSIPSWVRSKLMQLAARFAGNGKRKKYLELAGVAPESRYKGISAAFTPSALTEFSIFQQEEYEELLSEHFRKLWRKSQHNNLLNTMMYIDMNTWLPDDLLMKADKMTMAASQELRVPFLDHKLVEFAYSLPEKCKINDRQTKYLLRQLGKELLPAAIIKRPKKGFPVPVSNWFQDDFYTVSREVFSDSGSFIGEYFQQDYLVGLLEDHHLAKTDNSEVLWNLLVLEFWYRGMQAIPAVKE